MLYIQSHAFDFLQSLINWSHAIPFLYNTFNKTHCNDSQLCTNTLLTSLGFLHGNGADLIHDRHDLNPNKLNMGQSKINFEGI